MSNSASNPVSGFMSRSRTKTVVEGALCVALFVALSWVPLFRMPQGGSVSLDLVPLLIFAWRRGARWGCAAGALAGTLNLLLGGYAVHPFQVLLDYPLAFACVGLAGLWPRRRALSLPIAGFAKTFSHVLSGVFFFAAYTPEGTNVWMYSAVYNFSFSLPQFLICGAVAWVVQKRLNRLLSDEASGKNGGN